MLLPESVRRQGEVPRSLPVMDFLVVPLPENMFVDFTPTIVVSNGGDDCDGNDFETDDLVLQRARGLHFIRRTWA